MKEIGTKVPVSGQSPQSCDFVTLKLILLERNKYVSSKLVHNRS